MLRRRAGWRTALVMLAAAALVAGCGGGKKKELKLTIWEQMDPPERVQLEKHLSEYQKTHPGITVVHQNYGTDDLRTQFQTAANAGGGPELVFGPSDQIGPFSAMGLIRPLETTLGRAYFSGFLPGALDTLDGHLYYAPDQMGNHLVLIYNRRLVDHAPATTDELLEAAKQITRTDANGSAERYGMVLNLVEPFWLAPFLNGFGGWVMDAQHQPTLDSPGMVAALAYLARLRQEKAIPAECDYNVADNLFKEGKAAFLVNGPWSWQGYREAKIDLAIAPLPRVPATGRWCGPMTASKGYSINKNVSQDDLPQVLDLLRYLTSPQVGVDNAKALGTLPSMAQAYEDPFVKNDPFLASSRRAYDLGRRMPVVPEMRAIWDAMRPHMEKVLSGAETPEAAARGMQADAVKQIRTMKE